VSEITTAEAVSGIVTETVAETVTETAASEALSAVRDCVPARDWFQPDIAIETEARQVARELQVDWVVASRLAMMANKAQAITDYLNPSPQDIEHPEQTISGVMDASLALRAGIGRGEKVAVFADYDVDGQTSLAIIKEVLEKAGAELVLGSANASSGFGLTRDFVEKARGCQWLITVDCGSTQTEPIRLAQSYNMRVIVIDHHDVDRSNTADWHLNPRLASLRALETLAGAVAVGKSRQKLNVEAPYDQAWEKMTSRSKALLSEELGKERYEELVEAVYRGAHPSNTGSMLTWKFAAAFLLSDQDKVPAWLWGRPLYLAALGAVADMAPCDDLEVRAFVRVASNREEQLNFFSNRRVVPLGIEMIAKSFSEDPYRPDEMTRTRALLNLPKRTGLVQPEEIHALIEGTRRDQLRPLVASLIERYEQCSQIRRGEMDPAAVAQHDRAGYFSYAVLDGFENYCGYARMSANSLVREFSRPAVVFVRKTECDEFGQQLYKFSGANGIVPDAKLGALIKDEKMRAGSTIKGRSWLGEEEEMVCIGGHLEVVSGVCKQEEIETIKEACEGWAQALDDKKRWRPALRKRPRVLQRRVSPERLSRLNKEAALLSPFSFPAQPSPQISTVGRIIEIREDDDGISAILVDSDAGRTPVALSPELALACASLGGNTLFEVIVNLGMPKKPYLSRAALA
jgi:single-stranded DNA-specific DHH superfamily exonuclease